MLYSHGPEQTSGTRLWYLNWRVSLIECHVRSSFSESQLITKTKVHKALIEDLLFVDNAAVATHTNDHPTASRALALQALIDISFPVSLKETNLLGEDVEDPPLHQHHQNMSYRLSTSSQTLC